MDYTRAIGGQDDPASAEELRALQMTATDLAATAESLLSEAFVTESAVVETPAGPEAAVSIHPPEGPPVATGIPLADLEGMTGDTQRAIARDLVAMAVGRAKTTVGDRFMPVGQ